LKKIVAWCHEFNFIVTFSTLNGHNIFGFFGGVYVFHMPGKKFPIKKLYSNTPCQDYVEEVMKQAMNIHITHQV
jgi:pre-mRNA-splicing factor ATP-dependent RNA helicase DHX38/PRP16